jgi:hypothetical protein
MSFIYMELLFLMFLDHTQRRSTVGRTRPEESSRLCCGVVCDLETSRIGSPYIYDISNLRVNVHGSVHCKNFIVYIQYDATLHGLFYLKVALHVSGGTATCRYSGW